MALIKTSQEIDIMRQAGVILARIMRELEKKVQIGVSTEDLNELAEKLILKSGGSPSFKGYQNYPKALCASINEEIVHAVPSKRKIKDGDIVKLDLGIFYQGFHSDMAVTVPVGKADYEALRLIKITRKALNFAIKEAKEGLLLSKLGEIIENYIESRGFYVIKELCGHGIGRELHESPEILNFKDPSNNQILKQGMVICIEPMASIGSGKIKKGADGFAWLTQDGSFASHWEHTVLVTKTGGEILTK